MENYEVINNLDSEEVICEVADGIVADGSKRGLTPAGVVGVAALAAGLVGLVGFCVVRPIIKKVKAKKEQANEPQVIYEYDDEDSVDVE